MADLVGIESGERIEVALASGIPHVGALTAHDDRDVLVVERGHPGEVHPQVVAGGGLHGGVVEG